MTTSPPAAGSPAGTLSPIPFGRLARVELRKLTDTRVSRWLLIAIIAATPIVLAVMLAVPASASWPWSPSRDARPLS